MVEKGMGCRGNERIILKLSQTENIETVARVLSNKSQLCILKGWLNIRWCANIYT